MQIKVFDVVELKNNNLATILEIKDNKYFTEFVEKSPVLLITAGRNSSETWLILSSYFLCLSLQIYIFILDIYFFFYSLAED